jgi:hypothetical protein
MRAIFRVPPGCAREWFLEQYPIDTIVGVTGSRAIPYGRHTLVDDALFALDPQRVLVVTGGCIGVDHQAAVMAESFDMLGHAVLPPNRRLVAPDWDDYVATYEEIPAGPDGYRRRNQRVVDLADRLLAFPLYPEQHPQSRRSGTWQTIRMAQRRGIPVDVHLLGTD